MRACISPGARPRVFISRHRRERCPSWPKGTVSKTVVGFAHRGFESLSLRFAPCPRGRMEARIRRRRTGPQSAGDPVGVHRGENRAAVFRRGVRAAEGARLETVCSASYRGFESPPLRIMPVFRGSRPAGEGPSRKHHRTAPPPIEPRGPTVPEITHPRRMGGTVPWDIR